LFFILKNYLLIFYMKTSTQKFLEVSDIKQGVLVLKDNNIRGVLMVSSVNFDLKSQDERESTIYEFQNFLNSLDFTIQIISQTRKLNITAYLDMLKEREKKQTNELLRIQTAEYRKFVKELVVGGSIMTKYFYVIVPYYLFETRGIDSSKKISFQSSITSKSLSDDDFKRMRSQLNHRMLFLAAGLRRCGLSVSSLNTSQLIDLFWSSHHPLQAEQGYYPEIPEEFNV